MDHSNRVELGSTMPRLDTKLESEGAEFLVLGQLLINGISTYKTYTNFPGYDLVSVNPDQNKSVRIQVKSRYKTNWEGFIINNFNCDFIVFVALNRGYRPPRKSSGVMEPQYYVFPVAHLLQARNPTSKWGKINKNTLGDYESFENNWIGIAEFLNS